MSDEKKPPAPETERTLLAKQIENLERGRWYVQIHSQKAPDGNLWGWLLK